MNEPLYDLLSESITFGLELLVLLLAFIWVSKEIRLIKYNKETKKFERYEAEEVERFGRNVIRYSKADEIRN